MITPRTACQASLSRKRGNEVLFIERTKASRVTSLSGSKETEHEGPSLGEKARKYGVGRGIMGRQVLAFSTLTVSLGSPRPLPKSPLPSTVSAGQRGA